MSTKHFAAFALACALLAVVALAQAPAFISRYSIEGPCTLAKELEDICQVKSRLGSNDDGYHGLYMHFGETRCNVTIEQCRAKTCYSFRDLTQQNQPDASVALTTGFFTDITVVSGAKKARLTREGFAFEASSSIVRITYTTQTCAAYYSSRGRINQQLCSQPVEAITPIMAASPNSLKC